MTDRRPELAVMIPRFGEYADRIDLMLSAVGYESRSAHVAVAERDRVVHSLALAYPRFHLLAYERNVRRLRKHGVEILAPEDVEFSQAVRSAVSAATPSADVLRIGVDVSCMSRSRIVDIVAVLREESSARPLIVEFHYAPARFSVGRPSESVVEVAEPIMADFLDQAADPELPVAVIVGVGVEPNLALGVSEYMDVARMFAFAPHGVDSRYDARSSRANSGFYRATSLSRVETYNIFRPVDLLAKLDSLCSGLVDDYRVAFVPLGPKVFALCSTLVAAVSRGPVAIWRFSAFESAPVVDSVADGRVSILAVEFLPASVAPADAE